MSKVNWVLSAGLVLGLTALIAAAPPTQGHERQGPPHKQGHHHRMPDPAALPDALAQVPDQVLARVVRAVPGAAIMAIDAETGEGDEAATGYAFRMLQHGIPISAHVDAEGHITQLVTHAPPPRHQQRGGPQGGHGQHPGMQGPPPHMRQGPPQQRGQYGPPPMQHMQPMHRHPSEQYLFGPPPAQSMQGFQAAPPCPECRQQHATPPGAQPGMDWQPQQQFAPPPPRPRHDQPTSWNTPYDQTQPTWGGYDNQSTPTPSLFEPELTLP